MRSTASLIFFPFVSMLAFSLLFLLFPFPRASLGTAPKVPEFLNHPTRAPFLAFSAPRCPDVLVRSFTSQFLWLTQMRPRRECPLSVPVFSERGLVASHNRRLMRIALRRSFSRNGFDAASLPPPPFIVCSYPLPRSPATASSGLLCHGRDCN